MENSVLYATHLALVKMLFAKRMWNLYAYVPGGNVHYKPIWKVKTQKHTYDRKGRFSYDCLRYADMATGKAKPIYFDLGWNKVEHISTIGIKAVDLKYDYMLERAVIEKICQLADEGHDIVANKEIVLEKNRGAKLLMCIDLEAPSYSYMDEHAPF
jgi:hypothetical protein